MITMPTNRDENWRYANLRPLARARPEAVDPAASAAAGISLPAAIAGFEHWVFVDGRFARNLSTPSADSCATLLHAREAGQSFDDILDASLATEGVDFALARLNGSRGDEVLHIAPADGATAALELTFVATAAASTGTSYPRVQVHAGRGSRLRIIERHVSEGSLDSNINAAFDVALRADATLDHCRLQNCGEAASIYDTLVAHVGERASYRLRSVVLGGIASRSTQLIRLAGRGARCELTAASIAQGPQAHDTFAEIEHAAPETVTRELYRGIATGRGKLGFNGKMVVAQNAPGADSEQSLKTLLNGPGAEASVRPQLEIYTDRVRAVHGATTGKLDEQMLFYMLSRGLDRREAQALLQWAFIEDAVSRVDCGGLRQEIERLVAAQLQEVSSLDGLLNRP